MTYVRTRDFTVSFTVMTTDDLSPLVAAHHRTSYTLFPQ
jgi:hypothetical protein